MKKLMIVLLTIAMIAAAGCNSIKEYNTEENKAKIKALFEKYNTPENREKLIDAISKLMEEKK